MTATQQPAPPLSPDISVEPIRKLPGRRKPLLVELWQTGVGKKWVMGVTGVVLMLFIFGHAIGNLKMYLGAEEFNHYSEFLRELLVPILPRTVTLWLIRLGLIAAFAGHIFAAASLTVQNRKANVPYQSRRDYLAANFAARTMRWTGVIILLFLIFHLADLTWGLKPIATEQWRRGLAYENVTESLAAGRRGDLLHPRQPRPGPSTCSTGRGACSRASGSTTPASTGPGATSPPASPC